jgi:hypothetical protein
LDLMRVPEGMCSIARGVSGVAASPSIELE